MAEDQFSVFEADGVRSRMETLIAELNAASEAYYGGKEELMSNWQRMENGETLATINPLD